MHLGVLLKHDLEPGTSTVRNVKKLRNLILNKPKKKHFFTYFLNPEIKFKSERTQLRDDAYNANATLCYLNLTKTVLSNNIRNKIFTELAEKPIPKV